MLRQGMSLMELTLAVLILGVISAVAGLRYGVALELYQTQRLAERIAADIEAARHAARSRNQGTSVSFDAANQGYTVAGLANPDRQSATFTVRLPEIVANARLVSVDFGGDGVLQFNSFGVPDSGGLLTLRTGAATRSVNVSAGTGAVTVP